MQDMAANLPIRTLTEDDTESLVHLWEEAELEYRPRGRDSQEELQRQIRETSVVFLGAFDGNTLLGSVMATDDGRRGWINRLAVHPDSRRRGLGARLIEAAEQVLRRRDYDFQRPYHSINVSIECRIRLRQRFFQVAARIQLPDRGLGYYP